MAQHPFLDSPCGDEAAVVVDDGESKERLDGRFADEIQVGLEGGRGGREEG